MKHTKWQVDDCDKGIWVETDNEIPICKILRNGEWTLYEARKHAMLIASAPELLEALIHCRRVLEIANFSEELPLVNYAIAKATGEQK